VSSTMLDPRVIDASTLVPKLTSEIYLPVGVEGQMDAAGTATVGVVYALTRIDESADAFGPASSLHQSLIHI
jgi:hypothetical protein